MPGLLRRLLHIDGREVSVERRGFWLGGPAALRPRLEAIGRSFLEGYHAALETADPRDLGRRLAAVDLFYRGFAFEGAGMALTLTDLLLPGRQRRFADLLAGPGARHDYLLHVGAGWAWARLPGALAPRLRRLDPLLGWLALDGLGFHQGYFHHSRAVACQRVPRRCRGYARQAFDQGLGRSLWFVDGGDPERIAATVARFEIRRRGDLWSGVGLAAAYAGGAGEDILQRLVRLAGGHRADLAQGAAFAAKAREKAGNPSTECDLACQVLCGTTSGEAAAATDAALRELGATGGSPAYEIWRQRIRRRMAAATATIEPRRA